MKLAVAYSKRSAVKGVLKIKVTITKMMFFIIIYSWMYCYTLSERNTSISKMKKASDSKGRKECKHNRLSTKECN